MNLPPKIKCRKCGAEFQPTANSSRKQVAQCMACRASYNRAWRASRRMIGRPVTYPTPDAQKNAARKMLRYAVNLGFVTRMPCEVCGSHDSHGHHDDYSQPLAVRWLCPMHHTQLHRQMEPAIAKATGAQS